MNLVEIAFDVSLGKYNMRPKLPFHKMENILVAFNWLEKELKIVLLGIDANDLVKKQEKQTINVLWNVLRGLALKGIGSKDSSGGNNMRNDLLGWAAKLLDGTGIQVGDFWESFQDGIAFCAIVENMCPGSIDVASLKSENAKANLNLAFNTAEEKLGIPPLLRPEDLAAGNKPDEKSVMNYVCMLVSVGQGALKRAEQLQALKKKSEDEKAAKQREVEQMKKALEEKLEEEKKEMAAKRAQLEEDMKTTMEKFNAMQLEASSAKEGAEAERAKREEEAKQFAEAFETMKDGLVKEQTAMMESFDNERNAFRDEIEKLRLECEELREQLDQQKLSHSTFKAESEERIADLASQLYAAHKEQEDLVTNFRKELTSNAVQNRIAQEGKDADDALSSLLMDSINQQKSVKDFITTLPNKCGWLLKKRPDAKIAGRASHKRFFTLKGDTLYWGKDEKNPFEKKVVLDKYEMLDRASVDGPATTPTAASIVAASAARGRRRSSIMTVKKTGKTVMRLVPRDSKKDTVLDLTATEVTENEATEDITSWVDTVNTRISLLR